MSVHLSTVSPCDGWVDVGGSAHECLGAVQNSEDEERVGATLGITENLMLLLI